MEVNAPDYKVFNGIQYRLNGYAYTKKEAEFGKKAFQEQRFSVRTVKGKDVYGKSVYLLYIYRDKKNDKGYQMWEELKRLGK